MKKIYTVLVALALVLALSPLSAFAAETTPDYPKAVCTITDSNNNVISLKYDYFKNAFTNFPNEGDKIRIFYFGNTAETPNEEYVYHNGAFDDKGAISPFTFQINGGDYGNGTANVLISRDRNPFLYDSGYVFYINKNIKIQTVKAPLKSFTYSPSVVTVIAGNVKMKDANGNDMYSMKRRSLHTGPDHVNYWSSYAEGEKITVQFIDGTSKEYINQSVLTDNGYTDYFVAADGERIWPKAVDSNQFRLHMGMNDLTLYLMGQSQSITTVLKVYVKTEGGADYTETKPSLGTTQNNSSKGTSKTTAKKVVKLAIPIANAKITSVKKTGKRIKVTWKGLSKNDLRTVSNIQVQYSVNKNFKKAKTVSVSRTKKTYTTKKLKKGTYYARVRNVRKVNGKNYYSKWSAVKSAKVR